MDTQYVTSKALQTLKSQTETYHLNQPFPHIVIDNFLNQNTLHDILGELQELKLEDATFKFTRKCQYEYNKYTYDQNKLLQCQKKKITEVLNYLNSPNFIHILEKLTLVPEIIKNTEGGIKGSGVHRITSGGYLGIHTDFNSYEDKINGKMDRRINILIYLNPDWKDEYQGDLKLYEKNNKDNNQMISPILNRCVIFNTTSKSWHGHDVPLNTPPHIFRNSIANYYYTKSKGAQDFEGDLPHSTRWWINNFKDLQGK